MLLSSVALVAHESLVRWFLLMRRALKGLLIAAGVDFYMKTNDRRVLEDTILPAIADSPDVNDVLFIGCDYYTRGYRNVFAHCNYWTIEIDPLKSKFGARQHIADSAENLCLHFKPGTFDIILCNGVIGWGLDTRDGIERMLESCWCCLRERGVLLIGWNDVPEHAPVALSDLQSLRKFHPYVFPALGVNELETDTDLRHTYNFYTKITGT